MRAGIKGTLPAKLCQVTAILRFLINKDHLFPRGLKAWGRVTILGIDFQKPLMP
jgi:hypothetical protein